MYHQSGSLAAHVFVTHVLYIMTHVLYNFELIFFECF